MTNGEYYRILDMLLRIVEEHKTREALHIFNQFKEQLRKELNKNDA